MAPQNHSWADMEKIQQKHEEWLSGNLDHGTSIAFRTSSRPVFKGQKMMVEIKLTSPNLWWNNDVIWVSND